MSPEEQELLLSSLDGFLDQNVIGEVMEVVRGGKEATVFRCRAGSSSRKGPGFYAAKVYRAAERRSFRNDQAYQDGRVIGSARVRRAVANRSEFGREVQQHLWIAAEYATQRLLFDAGVSVPRPVACNGSAILMEWIGDEAGGAPQLRHAALPPAAAAAALRAVLAEVERMLDFHRIHGDLSPFNILYWDARPRIIDLPQAVDARMNANSYALLCRDVENVCRFFAKQGVATPDPWQTATRLWDRYVHGELGARSI
ncbi:MAG: serine protein kinase [Phycisphaerales bacterium]|nr:serine protein kinase [Phycisphaerales bacterium]